MVIKFKRLYKEDISDFELISNWDNQDDIKYLIRPNFIEGEIEDVTSKDLIDGIVYNPYKYIYIISIDDKKVGYVSIDTNFNLFKKNIDKSCWIGICIGDVNYHGSGVSKIAMEFLESRARKLNQRRIELGVFEYNKRAISFYKKMGYVEIGKNENFIYYNGKWQSDIRMEKYI